MILGIGAGLIPVALVPPGWVLPPPYDLFPPLPARGWLAAGWCVGAVAVLVTRNRFAVAATGVFAVFGFGFGVAYPVADDLRTRADFVAEVRTRTDADPARVALYHAADVVFELGHPAAEFATADELTAAVAAERVRWVVAPRRLVGAPPFPARVVAEETTRPWESADRVGNKLVLLETGNP